MLVYQSSNFCFARIKSRFIDFATLVIVLISSVINRYDIHALPLCVNEAMDSYCFSLVFILEVFE